MQADRVLKLLAELQTAYDGFVWESELWSEAAPRRSPYRALVLFGLSARTRDALLVEMCRRFFLRFPDAHALADSRPGVAAQAGDVVRAGQVQFVASLSEALSSGVPRSREGLMRINGVGEKIAECVLAYGWGDEALPLDANCVRVLGRVLGLNDTARSAGPLRDGLKCVYRMRHRQFSGLSIRMVDIHEILRLHGQLCCARTPECARCPVSGCASRRTPFDEAVTVRVTPELWDDWRELINEPFSI